MGCISTNKIKKFFCFVFDLNKNLLPKNKK